MPPTRLAALIVALVGGALALAGLVLGFGTVHASNVDGDCGSAFGGAHHAYYSSVYQPGGDQCSGPVSDRRTVAWALLAPGIAGLIAGSVMEGNYRAQRDREQRSARSELPGEA